MAGEVVVIVPAAGTGSRGSLPCRAAELADWVEGKSGPPRAVFEKAMEVILAEHDRRAAMAPGPKRRRTDH